MPLVQVCTKGSKAAGQEGHRAGTNLLLLNDGQDYAPSRSPGVQPGHPEAQLCHSSSSLGAPSSLGSDLPSCLLGSLGGPAAGMELGEQHLCIPV